MKIALVVKEIEGGGIQKSYLSLFHAFLKYQYNAYLFVLVKPPTMTVQHPNIIFLEGIGQLQKGFHLYKKTKELGEFDLAIVNAEYMKKYLPIQNKKIFLTVHVMWSHRLGQGISKLSKLVKLKYRYRNENIIAVSNAIKKDLLDVIKVHPKSVHIIPDAYDIDEIRLLAKEPIAFKAKFIVAVGSLLPVKRYDLMLKAFASLSHRSIHLIIIGSGKERPFIEQRIKQYGLEQRVHLTGFESNPYKYIQKSELLLLTSESEGFSRVIIEAFILEKPIVSTDCSPIFQEKFFPHELKDFIVPINDDQPLTEAIEKAFVDYPTLHSNFYRAFEDKNIVNDYINLVGQQ